MHAASPPEPGHTTRTQPSGPAELWAQTKKALGVATNAQAAARIGVSLSTMDRLFANPESSLLGNALKVSAATGISLDELVHTTRPPRQLSEAA